MSLFLIYGADTPLAQTTGTEAEELRQTEQDLQKSRDERQALSEEREALVRDLRALRQRMIIAAQDAQEREGIITNLERQLAQLAGERKNRQADLLTQRRQLAGTLSALGRLTRSPPQNILFQEQSPLETVRGAQLLQATVPALQERAGVIADQLAALDAVKLDITDKVAQLERAEEDLDQNRVRIDSLIQEKKALLTRNDTALSETEKRVKELVAKASSLQDLVRRLARAQVGTPEPAPGNASEPGNTVENPVVSPESEQVIRDETAQAPALETAALLTGPPEGLRSFPVNGQITRPVEGEVVRHYGQANGFDQTAKGISISTRNGAQITATFDGKVVYSGPFQDLGLILIIEHAGGYHSILAGFSRVDPLVGQWLLAGEPVGLVGAPETGSTNTRPELYVELRRDGQPVNPLRWISLQRNGAKPAKVKS